MKKGVGIFFLTLVCFVTFTSSAHAMTRDEILSEIARLTAVAEALASQIRALGAQPSTTGGTVSSGGTVSGTPRFDPTSVCTRITGTLSPGQTSSAVVSLQDALASVGVFTGSSTGYFGPMTVAAVRQFQTVNGLPATGVVGSDTAQALYQACTGGATYTAGGSSGTAVAPVDRSSLSVTPLAGRAPLSVTALFAINGTTCSSYSLDWGDGSTQVTRIGTTTGCVTDNINRQLAHVYAQGGAYYITLRTIRGSLSAAPIVAQSIVTVQ